MIDGFEIYLSFNSLPGISEYIQYLPLDSLNYSTASNLTGNGDMIIIGYNMEAMYLNSGLLLGRISIPVNQDNDNFSGFEIQYSLYSAGGETLPLESTSGYYETRQQDYFGFPNPFLQLSDPEGYAGTYLIYRFSPDINGLEFVMETLPSNVSVN